MECTDAQSFVVPKSISCLGYTNVPQSNFRFSICYYFQRNRVLEKMRRVDIEELTFCGEVDGSEKMDFVSNEYLSVCSKYSFIRNTLLCVLYIGGD